MGLHIGFHASQCSSHDDRPRWSDSSAPATDLQSALRDLPNPDPRNFRIIQTEQIGPWCVAKVVYPDCRNYEGQKIMLYRALAKAIERRTQLDPHFCDNRKCLSPFARFEPTERGWNAAVTMAHALLKQDDDFARPMKVKTRWDHLLEDDE